MQSETKLTARLVKAARNCKAIAFSLHGHREQMPGIPDCYFAHTYWNGWVEFKGPKTKLEAHQARIIKILRQKTVNAWVVRFKEQENSWWRMTVEDENGLLIRVIEVDNTDQKVFVTLMATLAAIEQGMEDETSKSPY